MIKKNFTHLNLHTEYSINDSLIRIDDLAERAQKLDFESLAITDSSNLFGFPEGAEPIEADCPYYFYLYYHFPYISNEQQFPPHKFYAFPQNVSAPLPSHP